MVKVYGIAGRTCAEIRIGMGKASLQIEFTKGCLDRRNFRPATYSTGNPVIQAMIENSDMFGSLIKIHRIYGEEAAVQTTARGKENPTKVNQNEEKVYPDVTTFEGVVEVLKSLGAKATNLNSMDNIMKFMTNKNIKFPNFKFEE